MNIRFRQAAADDAGLWSKYTTLPSSAITGGSEHVRDTERPSE